MRPIESCKGCGQLFGFLPRGYCADCLDAREEQFAVVKEWLFEHRGASISAAGEATGVPDATIMSFIREGRLEFVGAGGGGDGRAPASEADVKERIRRDLEQRATRDPRPAPQGGRSSHVGMRSRDR
ncbi:hypothetical protein [Miltoncostaea marina]|uniref:hypothetical protein n=1 Tax=Miltoncostaea marina TaxID=2843215 RepID=UPI001C3E4CD8|nr:hypothetical protein [Miltoncostaea marina]